MVLVAKAAYNVFDEPDYLLPLYETYFDTAYYVTDSFYYGTTQINNTSIVTETGSHPIGLMVFYMFLNEPLLPFYPYAPLKVRYNGYLYSEYGDIRPASVALYDTIFWLDRGSILSSNIYILFPILSPDPARTTPTPVDTVRNYFDTTQVVDPSQGGDTAQADTIPDGIVSAKLLERYVNVYPSVTDGGTVSVMSSFRLEAVEVYDAAGRMVSRQPASGLVAVVDASQLPAGAYLLNIKTVSGTATKKLVIQ
ncbi:MAG: T9SS type A sorting domain-containing protein [Bacteroidales bacterium]|nr:T9SS type A sorting domain-containing protein [Bacteroidales bacterium]